MKKQISIRISANTERQIEKLTARMGETQTGLITLAIDRMTREELGEGLSTRQLANIALEHWDNTEESKALLESIRDNPEYFHFVSFDDLSNYILDYTDYDGTD